MSHASPRGIAVMYHYVRPRGGDCPSGIRPLWTDEFEQQLDWLAQRFEIVDDRRLAGILSGTYAPGRDWCVLTFDDGTRDQAAIATPILARRNLSGFFFLLTGPWTEGRLPTAHRVHVLLSRVAAAELWEALRQAAAVEAGERAEALLGSEADARRIYAYEDSLERMRIKYAVNFAMDDALADAVLGRLISACIGEERALAAEWFVSPQQARAMHAAGMVIGAHGRNHLAIGKLSPPAAEAKIRHVHATLKAQIGQAPRWYAYPFGGAGASGQTLDHADRVLAELGYGGVFIYGAGKDRRLDVQGRGFTRMDRNDCIAFPPRGDGPFK